LNLVPERGTAYSATHDEETLHADDRRGSNPSWKLVLMWIKRSTL
jgi:hypothetical protein